MTPDELAATNKTIGLRIHALAHELLVHTLIAHGISTGRIVEFRSWDEPGTSEVIARGLNGEAGVNYKVETTVRVRVVGGEG